MPFHPVDLGASVSPAAVLAVPPAYDTTPFDTGERGRLGVVALIVTLLVVGLPVAGVVIVCTAVLHSSVTAVNLSLLGIFYLITAMGITAGFHRLHTHRSFTASPVLRASLAIAGSMAFEGGVISWIAAHRRHHAFSDQPGDPHSPYEYGGGLVGRVRGVVHAHMGWLFRADSTSVEQYAPDLKAEPMMVAIDRAFPLLCVLSLGLPTLAGYLLTGTANGALTALLWGGLVRVFLLHHVTWSVNSLCHLYGSRPFTLRRADRATNLWPLAVVSMGDSWHNLHHSDPTCARHGVDRHQLDIAAGFIRICEKFGWATDVRWPTQARIEARRV
jgi:stearoyl-CoA desaturase (delta-9 desaturase)